MDSIAANRINVEPDSRNSDKNKDLFPSIIDSSLSTTVTRPSEIFNELIAIHNKRNYQGKIHGFACVGILLAIGIMLLTAFLFILKYEHVISTTPGINLLRLILGLFLLGAILLIICPMCHVRFYVNGRQSSELDKCRDQGEFIVWRFEEKEWLRLLESVDGPDRQWSQSSPSGSLCCPCKSYARLSNRRYGHVVLCPNGFIIDELYLISFGKYNLSSVEPFRDSENLLSSGLRVHMCLFDGRKSRDVDFDITAPSMVTQEQLSTVVEWYNRNKHQCNRLNIGIQNKKSNRGVVVPMVP